MLLVSYDISNTKLRTRFSKFLKKFGYRLQYSVFEIQNSDRILENVTIAIKNDFSKQFCQTDSIMIFKMSKTCEITKYGYAKNTDVDLIVI